MATALHLNWVLEYIVSLRYSSSDKFWNHKTLPNVKSVPLTWFWIIQLSLSKIASLEDGTYFMQRHSKGVAADPGVSGGSTVLLSLSPPECLPPCWDLWMLQRERRTRMHTITLYRLHCCSPSSWQTPTRGWDQLRISAVDGGEAGWWFVGLGDGIGVTPTPLLVEAAWNHMYILIYNLAVFRKENWQIRIYFLSLVFNQLSIIASQGRI